VVIPVAREVFERLRPPLENALSQRPRAGKTAMGLNRERERIGFGAGPRCHPVCSAGIPARCSFRVETEG
jgi:hypothetical protein